VRGVALRITEFANSPRGGGTRFIVGDLQESRAPSFVGGTFSKWEWERFVYSLAGRYGGAGYIFTERGDCCQSMHNS